MFPGWRRRPRLQRIATLREPRGCGETRQTRGVQVAVPLRAWRFDSSQPHRWVVHPRPTVEAAPASNNWHLHYRHRAAPGDSTIDGARLARRPDSASSDRRQLQALRRRPQFLPSFQPSTRTCLAYILAMGVSPPDPGRSTSSESSSTSSPGHHRTDKGVHRRGSERIGERRIEAPQLRRGVLLLQGLALPLSSTWPWQEAPATNRPHGMATHSCQTPARAALAWSDRVRWLPLSEHRAVGGRGRGMPLTTGQTTSAPSSAKPVTCSASTGQRLATTRSTSPARPTWPLSTSSSGPNDDEPQRQLSLDRTRVAPVQDRAQATSP